MKLTLSCPPLQGGLTLWPNNIMSPCCLSMYGDFANSNLVMESCPDSFDMNAWQNFKNVAHMQLAEGISAPECRRCPLLQKMPVSGQTNNTFTNINIINLRKCNISCAFCYLPKEFRELDLSFNPHLGMFSDLVSKGFVNESTYINWGGGEPALHPNLRELYSLFQSAGCHQHFDTNSTIYMDFLEDGLRSGNVSLSCSLMTANAQTYHTLMGQDFCNLAWGNASTYAVTGGDVRAKYIILPENNGQEDTFLYNCKKIGISVVNLDCEIFGIRNGHDEALLIERAAKFIFCAESLGIDILYGVGITFLGDDFLCNIQEKILTKKRHNLCKYNTKNVKITLCLNGKNRNSLSQQVFFLGIISDINPISDLKKLEYITNEQWQSKQYGHFNHINCLFAEKQNSKFSFYAHYDHLLKLRFLAHQWSGVIDILIDGNRYNQIDLYSKQHEIIEVDMISRDLFRYRRLF